LQECKAETRGENSSEGSKGYERIGRWTAGNTVPAERASQVHESLKLAGVFSLEQQEGQSAAKAVAATGRRKSLEAETSRTDSA
jgi:hypothetical protein